MRANRWLAAVVAIIGGFCAGTEIGGYFAGLVDFRLLLRGVPPAIGMIGMAWLWWDWPIDFRTPWRRR